METHFDITYEVIDPITQERFETTDRFIAESHYENSSCTVYERHTTITRHSPFNDTTTCSTLLWHDDPEFEEA
jgi:hypothetical protein